MTDRSDVIGYVGFVAVLIVLILATWPNDNKPERNETKWIDKALKFVRKLKR